MLAAATRSETYSWPTGKRKDLPNLDPFQNTNHIVKGQALSTVKDLACAVRSLSATKAAKIPTHSHDGRKLRILRRLARNLSCCNRCKRSFDHSVFRQWHREEL